MSLVGPIEFMVLTVHDALMRGCPMPYPTQWVDFERLMTASKQRTVPSLMENREIILHFSPGRDDLINACLSSQFPIMH